MGLHPQADQIAYARKAFREQPAPTVPEGVTVDRENYGDLLGPPELWPTFKKHALVSAINVDGPFVIDTGIGTLHVENGWIAVDARGYPYPIVADEFELIYREDDALVPATTLDEATVCELLDAAWMRIDGKRHPTAARLPGAGRDFAMACTAIEDARMRYTRGRAQELGVFKPVDLDSEDAIRERQEWLGRVEAARAET